MTQLIKLFYRNILESGTVTMTSEDTAYPKYRLYDRGIGKLSKKTAQSLLLYGTGHLYGTGKKYGQGSSHIISIDQGSTIYEIDRLIIPAGHNLSGMTIRLMGSSDNFVSDVLLGIVTKLDWTQSGSGIINKSFTAATKRYWRLVITKPGTSIAPALSELFLTKSYEFQRNPSYGLTEGYRDNVYREESSSGIPYKTERGEIRKHRQYSLTKISSTQKADTEAAGLITRQTLKPFYIEDHAGNIFFAELLAPLQFRMEHEGRYGCDLELLEVLGQTT